MSKPANPVDAVVGLAVCAVIGIPILLLLKGCPSPEQDAKEVAAVQAKFALEKKELEQRAAREESNRQAYQSRDDFDNATRANTADRRKELERASRRHTMKNGNGMRIDTYHLKDGRVIVCGTTQHAAAAAVMNCDDEP